MFWCKSGSRMTIDWDLGNSGLLYFREIGGIGGIEIWESRDDTRYYREAMRSGCNFDGEGICGFRKG